MYVTEFNLKLSLLSFCGVFFAGRPQIIATGGSCYPPPNSIRSQKGYEELVLSGTAGPKMPGWIHFCIALQLAENEILDLI